MSGANSVAYQLAKFGHGLTPENIPLDVFDHARLMLADTIGVGIGGLQEDSTKAVISAFQDELGTCSVWGTDLACSPGAAALINGTLAHALDYDDNNMSMIGHSCAPVVPTVLSLADQGQFTLSDIITAFIVGVQAESVLGRYATLEHNNRGWHTTSTLGTLGATAAAAKMLRLDVGKTQHAFGIAVSMISGLKRNFGTTTKPLHAGLAARNGLNAAQLAKAGLAADPRAIEGEGGFYDLYAGLEGVTIASEDFLSFEMLNSFPKLYPTCSMVHQAIDIIIDGIANAEINLKEVDEVVCSVSYHAAAIMRYKNPVTPSECRFSIEYCVATALLRGEVTNDDFSEAAINNPELRDLMKRVRVVIAPDQADRASFERSYLRGEAKTWVEVIHSGGRHLKRGVALQKGHPLNPIEPAQLRSKFLNCLKKFEPTRAHELWRLLTVADPEIEFRPRLFLAR